MKIFLTSLFVLFLMVSNGNCAEEKWYTGDDRCPPPVNDGIFSAPYDAKDHPHDYPIFQGADKAGWSCSYQRTDGMMVQFGDSRTPQQQWMAIWGGANDNNN